MCDVIISEISKGNIGSTWTYLLLLIVRKIAKKVFEPETNSNFNNAWLENTLNVYLCVRKTSVDFTILMPSKRIFILFTIVQFVGMT